MSESGMSLVEMVVVIGLIGIFVAVGLMYFDVVSLGSRENIEELMALLERVDAGDIIDIAKDEVVVTKRDGRVYRLRLKGVEPDRQATGRYRRVQGRFGLVRILRGGYEEEPAGRVCFRARGKKRVLCLFSFGNPMWLPGGVLTSGIPTPKK